MIKKFAFLLLSFTFSVFFLFAQNDFRQGAIVRMNGDTIKGFIDYKEWRLSPESISFKEKVEQSETEKLTPLQIKSFTIGTIHEFVGYSGMVSINKTSFDNLPNFVDSTVKRDVSFLRVLSSGPNVKLLYHRDEVKVAYFIMDGNARPEELKYYPYIDDERKFIAFSPYIKQLIVLLQKYRGNNESWFDSSTKVDYNQATLVKYVRLINNNQSKEYKISGSRFYVGVAAVYLNTTFGGPESFGYESSTPASVTPMLNLGYDVLPNKYTMNTVFRLEASLWRASPKYNFYAGYFNYDAIMASFRAQLVYNFINKKGFKIYGGGGVAVNKPIELKNELVATDDGIIMTPLSLQTKPGSFRSLNVGERMTNPYGSLKLYSNLDLRFGFVFNDKFEIAIAGTVFSSPITDYYNSYLYPFSAGINYYLGKAK